MSSRGFIIAEFSDGIQVIPKIWLQSEDSCKYPAHYKTDLRIRKAIEKEEIPNSDWTSFKVNRIFGEYSSLEKANAKANQAIYTSDMDNTEKEEKHYRKYRARKVLSSSESEDSSYTSIMLPSAPCPPAKRLRLCNTSERGNTSITCSLDSMRKDKEFSNSSFHSVLQDASNCGTSYEKDEAMHKIVYSRDKTGENININRHINKMEEVARSSSMQNNQQRKEENLNYQSSQAAIVDHLKRLTREIAAIKYDMRQALTSLDILLQRTNEETESRKTKLSFEDAENRFPLQTVGELVEVEILKNPDSQHNTVIRAYIKSIGGTNVDDAVKRTLYRTFSNKLAEKYNWEGRRGKEPLDKLELIKVIFSKFIRSLRTNE